MMDIEKLIEAVRLCGSTPKVDQCKQCAYWSGGDMSKCIPRMTTDAATALSTIIALSDVMPELYAGLSFSKTNAMTDALNRLATYEDTGLEPEEIKEFAEDVIRQFAYHGQVNGRCAYTAGGLSTLEWAFQICGWDDPHPCPECECEVKNCHEWATGGRPTPDGYKFLCSHHYMAYEAREETEAAPVTNCD